MFEEDINKLAEHERAKLVLTDVCCVFCKHSAIFGTRNDKTVLVCDNDDASYPEIANKIYTNETETTHSCRMFSRSDDDYKRHTIDISPGRPEMFDVALECVRNMNVTELGQSIWSKNLDTEKYEEKIKKTAKPLSETKFDVEISEELMADLVGLTSAADTVEVSDDLFKKHDIRGLQTQDDNPYVNPILPFEKKPDDRNPYEE